MRAYMMDKDVSKLRKHLEAGGTVDEAKKMLAASGTGPTSKAVDDYMAGTPDLLKKVAKPAAKVALKG